VLKLVDCLRRRPELSLEEFQRYWRDIHAPLVAERAELLGTKRYVQVRPSGSRTSTSSSADNPRRRVPEYDASTLWSTSSRCAAAAPEWWGRSGRRGFVMMG